VLDDRRAVRRRDTECEDGVAGHERSNRNALLDSSASRAHMPWRSGPGVLRIVRYFGGSAHGDGGEVAVSVGSVHTIGVSAAGRFADLEST
jgi:hypothetical protein